jgi:hypothetical protein
MGKHRRQYSPALKAKRPGSDQGQRTQEIGSSYAVHSSHEWKNQLLDLSHEAFAQQFVVAIFRFSVTDLHVNATVTMSLLLKTGRPDRNGIGCSDENFEHPL